MWPFEAFVAESIKGNSDAWLVTIRSEIEVQCVSDTICHTFVQYQCTAAILFYKSSNDQWTINSTKFILSKNFDQNNLQLDGNIIPRFKLQSLALWNCIALFSLIVGSNDTILSEQRNLT